MNRHACRHVLGTLLCLSLSFPPVASGETTTTVPIVDIRFEPSAPYYQPQEAVATTGMPIRWLNATASHHSVRHDGCLTGETCAFESLALSPDSSFVIAPLPPGRYDYHCELHPIMRGTLIVEDPTVPETVSVQWRN